MYKVKLIGHEFRYEVYQILILFYEKDEFEFSEDDSSEIKLIYKDGYAESLINIDDKIFSDKIKVDGSNKRNIKNAIKTVLLNSMKKIKDIYVPWGILVGIRPTKLIHEYFNEGLNSKQAIERIKKEYVLTNEKAELVVEVAKNEAPYINKNRKSVSLYIDIPFCPTRCIYCSFTSNPVHGNQKLIEEYLSCLIREIDEIVPYINKNGLEIDTLYIGGGTPTSLSEVQIEVLLKSLKKHIELKEIKEFTIECGRPDTINEYKLLKIKEYGCSRISINPQTMNDETLKRIGRMHTSKDIIDKFNMARSMEFNDINMDIIIGLPNENALDVENTINRILELKPDSITMHTMAVKRASILKEKFSNNKNELAGFMYDKALGMIRNSGMHPYYMYRQKNMVAPLENVGLCYKDKECIYNIQIISESISIIGLGSGGVTKLVFPLENRIERVANVKDVHEYINRIDEMIERKKNAIDSIKLRFEN